VITGFNTDIEHDGVVYHVQTEDKGLDSPLILSLVYAGGEILASKRSRYEDLIASGFDEDVLGKRLKRQHRLICAAINAGRLEELKRMSARAEEDVTHSAVMQAASPVTGAQEVHGINEPGATQTAAEAEAPAEAPAVGETPPAPEVSGEESRKPRTRRRPGDKESVEPVYTVYDPRRQSPLGEVQESETPLVLTILDEVEYRAGGSFTIRVLVEDASGNQQKPLMGVSVSVKILGTAFRPQIYSVRTERDGIAAVSTTMPNFTSGRAAVLIRAVANGETTELRRIIQPAQ
jgi:hypothetical protein